MSVYLVFAGCRPGPSGPTADRILMDGVVITMDPARPEAKAVALAGDRILAVGDASDMAPHIGTDTVIHQLGGATVIPGLIDAHMHFFGVGLALARLDLVGTGSKQEVLQKLQALAEATPEGDWIRGRGWDQNDWSDTGLPTAADLDLVSPRHPVALTRIDGHALWVNSLALELAGIDAATADPAGGRIERTAAGEPSGVLVDAAEGLVEKLLDRPSLSELEVAAKHAAEACFAAGLTSVHYAGIGEQYLTAAATLLEAEVRLPRLYVMVEPGPALDALERSGPRIGEFNNRLTVRALKLYADGALGSRGAALLDDYSDEPGNRGLLVTAPEELQALVDRALAAGIQPAVHAIGDRGNRVVLDSYAAALQSSPGEDHRPRLEHAQLLSLEDLPRFLELGVIASMQPTHATSDMPWAEQRVGKERIAGAYAWRRLLQAGARLAFGSDAPVESVKPLWGLYAAVTRQDQAGEPEGGWLPDQRLQVEEALRLFTLDAAYSAFEEQLKGSLEPGKLADLVVLDRDPRKLTGRELLELTVRATVLGGETVYGALP